MRIEGAQKRDPTLLEGTAGVWGENRQGVGDGSACREPTIERHPHREGRCSPVRAAEARAQHGICPVDPPWPKRAAMSASTSWSAATPGRVSALTGTSRPAEIAAAAFSAV